MPQSMSDPAEKLHPIPHCEWCGFKVKPGFGNLAFQEGPQPNLFGKLEWIATSLCDRCIKDWRAMLGSTQIEK